jgi:hypothetical protein
LEIVMMQAVRIALDIKTRDVPALVCSDYSESASGNEQHVASIAKAVAAALGVQEFLYRPDRINELRRRLWEKDPVF